MKKPASNLDHKTPRRLPPLLRRAWYALNQTFRRRIAHLGITPDQFTTLRWLVEGDPRGLTQRQITDLMAADANTIASIVARMEKAGLLARATHETDRRAHRTRITAKGQQTFSKAKQVAIELQNEVLETLPSGRRDVFLTQLELVADACQEALEKTKR